MKSILTFCLKVLAISVVIPTISFPQLLQKDSYRLDAEPAPAPASNTILDVLVFGNTILLGTGAGLSRTRDNGLSFESFGREAGLGRGSASAVAVNNEVIWVATGFDTTTDFGRFQAGGGLAYSVDDGLTWNFVPQPGVTNVQNITFDIALRDDEVWITSFAGGLRKSSDFGMTWEIVTPDSLIFDPVPNLNHRVFSVLAVDRMLWVGSAGGLNRSNDGGINWTNFNHQNQTHAISGNFVVAIGCQSYSDREIIWAATRETTVESGDTTEFRGVSWSEDQGFSWQTALRGETVHNFAFDDSVVYAASANGIFKSIDGGETWAIFPAIVNSERTRRILTNQAFAAGVSSGHTLWVGTSNGLAKTSNDGITWEIFQVFDRTGREGTPRTYAYPNPFSPNVHNALNGVGHVRFQYNTINATRVTLTIFDFAMQLVKKVVENEPRPANADLYEIWNGTNERDVQVANGVYFYRLDLQGDGSFWGKLIVLN